MPARIIKSIPIAFLTVGLVGCSSAPQWTMQDSPSGLFTIEVPGNPDTQQQDLPLATGQSASAVISVAQAGDDGYTYSETTLPSDTQFDLDVGVQGSVDSMLANLESQLKSSGAATIVANETTEFDGNEARAYHGNMEVGDDDFAFRGLMYVDGDVVVQVVAFDRGSNNSEDIERFFDSMEPQA